MCGSQEDAPKAEPVVTEWLAVRGLQLSAEKTRITTLAEGFDFLGFNVRIYRTKTNHSGWKVLIKPSKKSVLKIRNRLQEECLQLPGHSVMPAIKPTNP